MTIQHHTTQAEIEIKSYVVSSERGEYFIKATHFQPGYTPLHQPTAEAAVVAFSLSCVMEIEAIRGKIAAAEKLLPNRELDRVESLVERVELPTERLDLAVVVPVETLEAIDKIALIAEHPDEVAEPRPADFTEKTDEDEMFW